MAKSFAKFTFLPLVPLDSIRFSTYIINKDFSESKAILLLIFNLYGFYLAFVLLHLPQPPVKCSRQFSGSGLWGDEQYAVT